MYKVCQNDNFNLKYVYVSVRVTDKWTIKTKFNLYWLFVKHSFIQENVLIKHCKWL